jgi:hypothetical protein
MASWIYDEKFLTGMQFMFVTSSFTVAHNDDLEHPAQKEEEWCTTMIAPGSRTRSATHDDDRL